MEQGKKNWKSNLAFFVFLAAYVFAVYSENVKMAEVTSWIALLSTGLIMARSDTLNSAITNITEAFASKHRKE